MPQDEPTTIREAMDAADNFLRWSRHHLGNGRPEHFERARVRLAEALDRLRTRDR